MDRLDGRLWFGRLVDACQVPTRHALDVRLEYMVGVIEERNDLLKLSKVAPKITVQFASFGKESRHASHGNVTNTVQQLRRNSQLGDVWIAQQLDVRSRPSLANRSDHRHGEDKIPDRERWPGAHIE